MFENAGTVAWEINPFFSLKKKINWKNSNSVLIFIIFKLVTLQDQPNYVKDKLK